MSAPTLQISCSINSTDPLAGLGLTIRLDNQVIFDQDHIDQQINFQHTLNDDDAEHYLEFVMKNKTDADTTVDQQGNIVKDACLTITNVTFDEIQLGQIFIDQAIYTHDFNGTQPKVQDKFYGTMGCNGTVGLKFTTPIYIWLLERM